MSNSDIEMTSGEVELIELNDQFQIDPTVQPAAAGSVTTSTYTLPEALCDQELLSELAQIPNRMAFKIGDVSDLLGIKQYVLRYWETEFDELNPKKASNNQRMYSRRDVETAYLIRKLLHRDRFSIEGAKAAFRSLRFVARQEVKKDKLSGAALESIENAVDDLFLEIKRIAAYLN